jgi:anaerobic magnesium-protoporphyrin IX monomethyl ester cyclase
MRIVLIKSDDEMWAQGMRSISATLRAAGHETTMVFAGSPHVTIDDAAIHAIASVARDADLIGISSMSRGSERAKEIIRGLRPLGRLIAWGGMHPTLYPDECAAHADVVCCGEGEGFMLDLAERVASGRPWADIPNGVYLRDGNVVRNDLRPLIADLDTLPFLDFEFEDELVLDSGGVLVPNGSMRESDDILFSGSRGCNNSCAYCSNSQLKAIYRGNGRYARKMSVPRFVEAAAEFKRLFPHAVHFFFTDEDFLARPVEELQELAELFPGRVGLPFEVMASPRETTEEKVVLAVEAGMWRIDQGLESGSERTRREVFDRYVDDETQLRAAKAVATHPELVAYYFLILGNPYEERKDLLDGIRFLRKMPTPHFLRAYNLVFFPGTKLFDRARADGIIAGVSDSAFDIDFLAGFDPAGHEWKRKNLYLNSLISLMVGRSDRWRMGCVPRPLLPVLTSETVVDFGERHEWISNAMVEFANAGLNFRRAAATVIGRIVPDRRVLYRRKSVRERQTLSASTAVRSAIVLVILVVSLIVMLGLFDLIGAGG